MELAPIPVERPRSLYPSPNDMQAMIAIARNVPAAAGHAVPKGISAGQAFAIMLAGHEIGIGPMTAMRHITAINGRTEPDAQLMMGICLANDPTIEFRWEELSRTRAALDLYRKGTKVMAVVYSLEDAEQAGQLKKPTRQLWGGPQGERRVVGEEEFDGPWQTHTILMLAYNAIKIACKLGAPDLINNVAGVMGQLVATEMVTEGEGMPWEGVGDLGGDPDFAAEGKRPAKATTPQRPVNEKKKPAQRPPRTVLMQQVKDAMAEQKVAGAKLSALVGGTSISFVEAWLTANPEITVAQMIERAGALVDLSTGEVVLTDEERAAAAKTVEETAAPAAEPEADGSFSDAE